MVCFLIGMNVCRFLLPRLFSLVVFVDAVDHFCSSLLIFSHTAKTTGFLLLPPPPPPTSCDPLTCSSCSSSTSFHVLTCSGRTRASPSTPHCWSTSLGRREKLNWPLTTSTGAHVATHACYYTVILLSLKFPQVLFIKFSAEKVYSFTNCMSYFEVDDLDQLFKAWDSKVRRYPNPDDQFETWKQ